MVSYTCPKPRGTSKYRTRCGPERVEVQVVEGLKTNIRQSCCCSPDQNLDGNVNTGEGADYGYRHR